MSLQRQRGVSALEFAIALPVMLLLLWGVVSFASLFYVQMAFSGAVTDGARLAATLPTDEVETQVKTSVHRALARFGLEETAVTVGNDDECDASPCIRVSVTAQYDELRGIPVLAAISLPLVGTFNWMPDHIVAEASVLR